MATGEGEKKTETVAKENRPSAWLLGGMGLVVSVFTAAGVEGGMLGRMARNEHLATMLALILAFAAVIAGAMATWVVGPHEASPQGQPAPVAGDGEAAAKVGGGRKEARHRRARKALFGGPVRIERTLFTLGSLLLLGAGISAAVGAVGVWGDRTRPQVTATVAKSGAGTVLDIHVRAASFHANDRLWLIVRPVSAQQDSLSRTSRCGEPPDAGTAGYSCGAPIYMLSEGPDVDGNVDHSLKVAFPAGRYKRLRVEAYREGDNQSSAQSWTSVVVALPEAERPQLKAAWELSHEARPARTLVVTASARDVPNRILIARVLGAVPPARHRLLAEWSLAPNADGDFVNVQRVPVPPDVRRVCIVVSSSRLRAATCPQRYFLPPVVLRKSAGRGLAEDAGGDAALKAKLAEAAVDAKRAGTVWLAVRAP